MWGCPVLNLAQTESGGEMTLKSFGPNLDYKPVIRGVN